MRSYLKIAGLVAFCLIGVAVAIEKNDNNVEIEITLYRATCTPSSCPNPTADPKITFNTANNPLKTTLNGKTRITQIVISANGKSCSYKYSPETVLNAPINTDPSVNISIDSNNAVTINNSFLCELK